MVSSGSKETQLKDSQKVEAVVVTRNRFVTELPLNPGPVAQVLCWRKPGWERRAVAFHHTLELHSGVHRADVGW